MLLAGQVGKPHGISGEVYVVPISDDARRFEPGATLWRDDGGTLVVESSHDHADRFLVKFEGVTTRDEAEALRGPLYIPASEARALEDDEYWPHDLEGCAVVVDGNTIGTVAQIVVGAAQDLIEVTTERGPRLVPFVKEIVVEVDVDARRVTIDPPEGLLD
ncbi:MAG TPA: ribosome maturation factor RimM [Actinomycetota bacterium]|jgi:16S rRNA processing protein RimM